MTQGLELRGFKLIWRTKKPYWNCPRESPRFLFRDNECYFELLFKRETSQDYEIRLCNNRETSLQVTTYLQHEETYKEYGRVTHNIRGEKIGTFHMESIAGDMVDFHSMKFLQIVTIFDCGDADLLQLCPSEKCAPRTPKIGQGYYRTDDRLSIDFGKLLEGGSNHDVELKCGGTSIKAHRIVLSARSQVLQTMLQNDNAEGLTGLVEIQDMEADVLRGLVEFLYTGKLEISTTDKAKSFYRAGDKYMVQGLVEVCCDFLIQNLASENACENLVFADFNNDQRLKDCVMSYILAEDIPSQGDQWLPFTVSHQKLAFEVLDRFYRLRRKN